MPDLSSLPSIWMRFLPSHHVLAALAVMIG